MQQSSAVDALLFAAGLGRLTKQAFSSLSMEEFLGLSMRDLGHYLSDPADKNVVFALLRRLRAELASQGAAEAPGPAPVAMESRKQPLHSQEDLLDLDEHDGDLLDGPGGSFTLSPLMEAPQACGGGRCDPAPRPSPAGLAAAAAMGGPLPPLTGGEDPPKIKVVVRKRPISRKERERGDDDMVEVSRGGAFVIVNETKVKVDLTKYMERHQFNFDEALDEFVTNDQVYRTTVQPLVATLFANGKATCFAYGQTGSGKTYTMSPLPIRAAADLLQYLAKPQWADVSLYVSCFEIYGNKVFDLLNGRKKLNILEDGKKQVCVVGLKEHIVDDVEVVKQLIEEASMRRSTGSTAANADSSRSHSIMQFTLKRYIAGGAHCRQVGKISFIDLAGSERGADTFDNNRQTRMEGAEINKSLLALKECIRALDSDARHVPFRGSKLTAVLRDSFIGDTARTVMIANISPTASCVEHTLNTLRYADRVKELRKDRAERDPGSVTPGEDPAYYAAVERAAPPALPRGSSGRGWDSQSPYESDFEEEGGGSGAGALPPGGGHLGMASVAAAAAVVQQQQQAMQQQAMQQQQQLQQQQQQQRRARVSAASLAAAAAANAAAAAGPGPGPGPSSRGGAAAAAPPPPHQAPPPAPPALPSGAATPEDVDSLIAAREGLMEDILEEEEEIIALHRQQIEESMDVVRKEMAMLAEVDQPGSAIDAYVEALEAVLSQKLRSIHALQARVERFKQQLKQEEVMSNTVQRARFSKART
ncbi:kinesin-13A-like [Raphidocelis subcapitata]|uniref:Kinesin-like protein n=1 Tax=Raphidocelis subcapitata TaxID=307507 RepID=A0A2V0NNG4_9CHLO|nr:kinesin-13A-like [Raphidocelis subcapitata]|eukprot:GBF89094.1 kinesin-13A-like [Raphidocelis subcapitata]